MTSCPSKRKHSRLALPQVPTSPKSHRRNKTMPYEKTFTFHDLHSLFRCTSIVGIRTVAANESMYDRLPTVRPSARRDRRRFQQTHTADGECHCHRELRRTTRCRSHPPRNRERRRGSIPESLRLAHTPLR